MAFTKSYGYVDLLPESVSFQNPEQKSIDEEQMAKNGRYSPSYVFDENDQYKSLENRLIVINGEAVKDNNKFYGVRKADRVLFLNATDGKNKYGANAKYGAVEVYGDKQKLIFQPRYVIADTAKFPAPVNPKKDQVKFPPPIIRKDKTKFYPMRSVDKKGNVNSIDLRTIVINGKKVEDLETFYGVTNATNIVDIDAAAAIKKYGKNAKYGAVEITGSNLKYVKSLADGPPPPIMEQVKFPPPIVKPNQKKLKDPPPIEEPPTGYKRKSSQVNKTPNLNPAKPNLTKVVQGFPINSDGDQIKEVKIQAYPQSNPTKVVQGFPINSNRDQLKEVKVQAYPQKANPTKVVQGFPINRDGDQIKEVKIQAYPQSNKTKAVQGYPINKNKIKEVKIEGYPSNPNKYKSNEPKSLDEKELQNSPYQTKLSGLASPEELAQKPTAYTLRGKVNTHKYVRTSTTVYLADPSRLKKN